MRIYWGSKSCLAWVFWICLHFSLYTGLIIVDATWVYVVAYSSRYPCWCQDGWTYRRLDCFALIMNNDYIISFSAWQSFYWCKGLFARTQHALFKNSPVRMIVLMISYFHQCKLFDRHVKPTPPYGLNPAVVYCFCYCLWYTAIIFFASNWSQQTFGGFWNAQRSFQLKSDLLVRMETCDGLMWIWRKIYNSACVLDDDALSFMTWNLTLIVDFFYKQYFI